MIPTNVPVSLGLDNTRRANITPGATGNQGLYFTKFFNQWVPDFSETIKDHSVGAGADKKIYCNGKMSWILSQVHDALSDNTQFETGTRAEGNRKIGNAETLKSACHRIRQIVGAQGKCETFRTTSPFVTGMGLSHPIENGFLWHHTLGVPYLPGSSVKGMMRAWVRDWWQEDDEKVAEINRLFGHETEHPEGPAAGRIIVFDALPNEPVSLMAEIITPHSADWRITTTPAEKPPADWVSPVPIPFLAVAPGASFQFALAPRAGAQEGDLDKACGYLAGALEWIGAGAKTAIGFGRFQDRNSLPLAKDDRVRVLSTFRDAKWHGVAGTIIDATTVPGSFKVKRDPLETGKRPETYVPQEQLERLTEDE